MTTSSLCLEGSLPQEIISKLFAVLKSWAGDMDAFRYEMFAKRLVAAERGRSDAVEWAKSWYDDVMAEERQAEKDQKRLIAEDSERRALARDELQAGRSSNPRYQAFLDTVEHPELLSNNADYFIWMADLIGKFESLRGIRDLPNDERQSIMNRMIQEKRDANLAPRLRNRDVSSS